MTQSTSADADSSWGNTSQEAAIGDVGEVLVCMDPGENRRSVRYGLDEEYDVTTADAARGLQTQFDLCILNEAIYTRHRQQLQTRKRRSGDAFLPLLLMVDTDSTLRSDPDVWTVVDEVVSMPVGKPELRARVEALLRRRRESLHLLHHKEQLREAVAELRVKERAIEAAPFGVSITDYQQEDNPLVYVNQAFEELTGYTEDEVLGQNCRFLQGPATDEGPVGQMRAAIDDEEAVSVELTNYDKSGRQFWNGVDMAPVEGTDGEVTHFVGFQRDVTHRRIREQRLTVLNRVIRHNLRNDLSVILGYTETLQDAVDDPSLRSHLDVIHDSGSALVELGNTVHDVESVLRQLRTPGDSVPAGCMVESVISDLETRYPDRSVTVSFSDRDLPSIPDGVQVAIRKATEMAMRDSTPDVDDPEVVVSRSPDPPGSVEITVVDNGSGIPDTVKAVHANGNETPLTHADGIGVWLIEWIVHAAGGCVDIEDTEDNGSVITMQFSGVTSAETVGDETGETS